MIVEPPRNFFVSWIEAEGKIGGQHGWGMMLRPIVCVRHGIGAGAVLRRPLKCPRRTLREFPIVLEKVLEVIVAPLRRRGGPDDLQTATDRVIPAAGSEFILPAEALLLHVGRFWLRADILGRI